jgi:hypothetical protein
MPKTRMTLLRPNLKETVEEKQRKTKETADGKTPKMRSYDEQQKVLVRQSQQTRKGEVDTWHYNGD